MSPVTPRLATAAKLARVLVVDDEPLVGRAVRRVLADRSEVMSVTSAREALALLADGGQAFDVIFCDLMMPDMTGPEFRTALATTRPDLVRNLVFITGGAFTPEMEQFLAQSGCKQLLKPFDVAVLRSVVEEAARGR
ncbi:MAG: response regulator [Deltaproteobacteria bacterium]|nr:response regulator [Deltaproteobacteria bacterium]